MINGKIIKIEGNFVDVLFNSINDINLYDLLDVIENEKIILNLEVLSKLDGNIVHTIALGLTLGLSRNSIVNYNGNFIRMPEADNAIGRMMDPIGNQLDDRGYIPLSNISTNKMNNNIQTTTFNQNDRKILLETGIKVIDFFCPIFKGKPVVFLNDLDEDIINYKNSGINGSIYELIFRMNKDKPAYSVYSKIANTTEINNNYRELIDYNIIVPNSLDQSKIAIITSSPSDQTEQHLNTYLSGISLAETFLNKTNGDILLFMSGMNNLYSPLSLNYNIINRCGLKENGSITPIFVDYKLLSNEKKTTITFSTKYANINIYPPIDPLKSQSDFLTVDIVSEEHYKTYIDTIDLLNKYETLNNIITIKGLDVLTAEDKNIAQRARKIINFLSQPFFIAEIFTGSSGKYVTLTETIKGIKMILNGELNNIQENAFYMVGNIDEVIEKSNKI